MLSTLSDFERVPRILRLNIAGQPVEWVAWQDAVCLYARDLVVWTVGDPPDHHRGGHSKHTGEASSQTSTASSPATAGWWRVPRRPALTNLALFQARWQYVFVLRQAVRDSRTDSGSCRTGFSEAVAISGITWSLVADAATTSRATDCWKIPV